MVRYTPNHAGGDARRSVGEREDVVRLRVNSLPLILISSCLLLGGCANLRVHNTDPAHRLKVATLSERHAEAVEAYDEGHYAEALVAIESIVDRMEPSPEHEELLFVRADAYHQSRNYHDAERAYADYLAAYPEGRYQGIVTQGLMRLPAERAEIQTAAAERLDNAHRDLDQLLLLEKEFPRDPQIKYLIGNLYYQTESYDDAGKYYFAAQSLEAAYKEKDLIQQRLYIDAEGNPRAMTPRALREMSREQNALVVFDVYPYRERGSDSFNSRLVYANVSGKVRNQAERTVHDVSLEIRFLNATGDILDLEIIPIGTLPPGGVRAFLASARHYDNLFNITEIEVIPRGV